MKSKKQLLALCEAAMCVALALGLSYLKIPIGASFGGFGGSIDFVMVPLIILALRRGVWWGLGAGLAFGTLKFFVGGGTAVNWQSMLLDYSVAYMAVGIAGLLRNKKPVFGTLVGCLGRFAVHFFSGITVYAEYMPERFLDLTMTSTVLYSVLYNGTYMLPNTVIAVVVLLLAEKPLKKWKIL